MRTTALDVRDGEIAASYVALSLAELGYIMAVRSAKIEILMRRCMAQVVASGPADVAFECLKLGRCYLAASRWANGKLSQKMPFRTRPANDRLWSIAASAASVRGRAAICGLLPGT